MTPLEKVEAIAVDWASVPELADFDFDALCRERQRLSDIKATIEPQLKAVNESISLALQVTGHKSLLWDNHRVTVVNGRSAARLDAKLLLEHGVAAATIADCIIPGTEFVTVSFKEIKDATPSGK